MSTTDKIKAFQGALRTMSHSRAGWDYELPREQRAREDREAKTALAFARTIWAENPDMHEELRAAFADVQPLVSMSEIERA